jgi:hypothetical protein
MLFNALKKENIAIADTTSFRMPYIFGKKKLKRKQFAEGIIRVRRLPEGWTSEDYAKWWLPTTDGEGKILIPARMSEKEKERYQEAVGFNQIMNAGRTAVLSYIGSPSGSSTQWSQEFAVGTGLITGISPTDTSLSNEIARKIPASFSVTGTLVDINIQFGITDAVANYTNAGLFGNGASSTLGSGTMMTKALFSYSKGSFAIAVDYLINLL